MSDQKSTQPSHERAPQTDGLQADGQQAAAQGTDNASPAFGLHAALALVFVALALLSGGRVGLWEPWETKAAELGIALQQGAIGLFRPLLEDELLARGWLEPALLLLGAKLGGSELAFRMPFALLMGLALFVIGSAVSARFGKLRGVLALIFSAATPMIALSTTSLAGDATLIATTGVGAMLLASVAGRAGEESATAKADTSGRSSNTVWAAAGAALGFSFLTSGLLALGPLLIAAAIGAAATTRAVQNEERTTRGPAFWLGALLLATGLLAPLLAWKTAGADAALRWAAAGLLFDLPLAALLLGAPRSSFAALCEPRTLASFLAPLALLALPPLLMTWSAIGGDDTLRFILHHDLLSGQSEGRTTFDVLIRLAGFSSYPLTALLPLGAAWTFSRKGNAKPGEREQLYGGAFGLVLVGWMAASVAVIGVSANFSALQAMPVAIPIAVLGALALSDRDWVREMGKERASLYAATLASVMILVVMSKDVMGQFDEEAGRPGPRVIFEFLLHAGELPFPADYTFVNMRLLVALWALLFVALGALVVATALGSPSLAVGAWRERLNAMTTKRWLRAPLSAALRPVQWGLRVAERPRIPAFLLGAFALSLVLWNVLLVGRFVPDIAPHVSNRGLIDAWERYAEEGEPLYTAEIDLESAGYYLGEQEIAESFRLGTMLRGPFCNDEERVFAIMPTEELARTRHAILSYNDCEGRRDAFHVLYSESARYALVSNQLDEAAGERDDSVFATHVFSSIDDIPESAERFASPYTFDGDLRLVAASVEPDELSGSGEVMVRTWWEVRDRVNGEYEMFIHADTPRNRINGDHEPVFGMFPTRYWLEGDIVLDEYPLDVSRFGDRRGVYDVHVGFFRGDNRMSVSPAVAEDRVKIGTLTLR